MPKKTFYVYAEKIRSTELCVLANTEQEVLDALDNEDLDDWNCDDDLWDFSVNESDRGKPDFFINKYLVVSVEFN